MFDEFFEAVLADDAESRDAHFRLRFQVYCRETGFERALDFPDGRERDELDETAAAFLVRSRASGDWIATMRLVVGRVAELPVAPFLDPFARSRAETAGEISRFCVSPRYRRRTSREIRVARTAPVSESRLPRPESREVDSLLERPDPWILIGLLRAARQYSEERSIERWFFLAADSMAAAVRMAGFSITEAGPESDHRGRRCAYRYDLDVAEEGLAQRSPNVAQMFSRRPAYRPASQEAVPSEDSRLCSPAVSPDCRTEAAP